MNVDTACFVIFGATGNLTLHKLMPALYQLYLQNKLADDFTIVAVSRKPMAVAAYYANVEPFLQAWGSDAQRQEFATHIHCSHVQTENKAGFTALRQLLLEHLQLKNIAFYMAVKPDAYLAILANLAAENLFDESLGYRRVVIEKPIGRDLQSAQKIQAEMEQYLKEKQLYRIDHYLAKAMVQNVLVFRFANILMEPLWNRNYIDHVQITHSEKIGVDERGEYYDGTGSLCDMLQSHLVQLLALVTIEAPASMQAKTLRDEKVKLLQSVRPITADTVDSHAIRGQYAGGEINGKACKAYRNELHIAANSNTETYAALKLNIDNWRWQGVPFYLSTGKRMAQRQTTISICFKQPPTQFFESQQHVQKHNWLLLGVQPEPFLNLQLTVKQPGLEMLTTQTNLQASFNDESASDAYQELLLDVLEGDQSLFLRWDEVESAWAILDPVIQNWRSRDDAPALYASGSWGPEPAAGFFHRDDLAWRYDAAKKPA